MNVVQITVQRYLSDIQLIKHLSYPNPFEDKSAAIVHHDWIISAKFLWNLH